MTWRSAFSPRPSHQVSFVIRTDAPTPRLAALRQVSVARDAEIARRIRARQVQAAHLSQAADAKALQLAAHLVPQRVQRARLIDPPEAQTRLKLMVDARGATLCVQAICDWLGLVHLRQARVNERQAPIGEGTQNQVAKVNVVKDNYVAWMRLPARVVVDVPGDRI